MAIIKYQLDGGETPNYITDGHYFYGDDTSGDIIGIGSGGGTVMSKSELITFAIALYNAGDLSKAPPVVGLSFSSESEVTNMVNAWCRDKRIS